MTTNILGHIRLQLINKNVKTIDTLNEMQWMMIDFPPTTAQQKKQYKIARKKIKEHITRLEEENRKLRYSRPTTKLQ